MRQAGHRPDTVGLEEVGGDVADAHADRVEDHANSDEARETHLHV